MEWPPLFAKIGPGILLTHSASGGPGFLTATKSANIKGHVAYEPGDFIFPQGETAAHTPDNL